MPSGQDIEIQSRNVQVLLSKHKHMYTEIDVKVYESPQEVLRGRINRFLKIADKDQQELLRGRNNHFSKTADDDQVKVLRGVKEPPNIQIEKALSSIRKLPMSGYT